MLFSGAIALTLASLLLAPVDATTIPLSKRDVGIRNANGSVNLKIINQEIGRLNA